MLSCLTFCPPSHDSPVSALGPVPCTRSPIPFLCPHGAPRQASGQDMRPGRPACVSTHSPTRRAAPANAAHCICQRGALHLPTRRTASANAARCICQRGALHPPTRRTASANAAHCICQRGAVHLESEVSDCAEARQHAELSVMFFLARKPVRRFRVLGCIQSPLPPGGVWEEAFYFFRSITFIFSMRRLSISVTSKANRPQSVCSCSSGKSPLISRSSPARVSASPSACWK